MGRASWGGSRGHLDAQRPYLCLQGEHELFLVLRLFRTRSWKLQGEKKWYQPASETPSPFVSKQRESSSPRLSYLSSSIKYFRQAQAGFPGPSALLRTHSPGTMLSICLLIYSSRFLCFPCTNQRVVYPCSDPSLRLSLDHACLASPLLFQGTRHGWQKVRPLITFSITAPVSLQILASSPKCSGRGKGSCQPCFPRCPGKGNPLPLVFTAEDIYAAGGRRGQAWGQAWGLHCRLSGALAVGKILA